MQRGLIPFLELESNQPLAQKQSHAIFSGEETKGGMQAPHPTEGCTASPETARTAQGHSQVAQEQDPEALTPLLVFCPSSPSVCYSRATFTVMFRLQSYQGLQKITYPLLQHNLQQNGSLNSFFPGLWKCFSLRRFG